MELRKRKLSFPANCVCAMCGQEITQYGQVHEVIVTRGLVQSGSDELRLAIHSPWNCVELCSEKCHQKATSQAGKMKCIAYLLIWEGIGKIIAGLDQLADLGLSQKEITFALTEVFHVVKIMWHDGFETN